MVAIKGYEGIYAITSCGKVWSYKTKRFLKTIKTQKGYEIVYLYKDNSVKHPTIHKLVAMAYIPNPNNLPQINHKDENGTNNCVENLEWCNHRYNAKYNKYPEKPNTIPSKVVSREQKQKTSISVKKYRREHAKLKFEYNGEMLSIPEIAEKTNVRQGTLWQRYCRTGSIFLSAKMDGGREENEG